MCFHALEQCFLKELKAIHNSSESVDQIKRKKVVIQCTHIDPLNNNILLLKKVK